MLIFVIKSLLAHIFHKFDLHDSNNPSCQSTTYIDANCETALKVKENSYTTRLTNQVNILKLYPNPARATLFVDYPATQTTPLVEVFDLLRQRVISQKMDGTELNISHLQKGLYHLVIREGEVIQTKKFIKE